MMSVFEIQNKTAKEIVSRWQAKTCSARDGCTLKIWARALHRFGGNIISPEAVAYLDTNIPEWRVVYLRMARIADCDALESLPPYELSL